MWKSTLLLISLFFTTTLMSQERMVSGTVLAEEDNLPLIGANVIVEGTTIGTITDIDGRYTLNVPAGKKLVFSYLGYKETILAVNSNEINVILRTDSQVMDEVVAIGYGTMRKSDLTGAVASVKADQLQRTPASGLDQALQGRAAGVTVSANSGQPGEAAQIRIRGIGTVNESGPIYVVDGLIVGDIAFLSPNDIESTEILKDASSTAIYGSRGANGVILVTTKKGKEGKGTISFNSYVGFQNRWKKLDLMKGQEFASTIIALNNVRSEMNYYEQNGFNEWLSAYRLGTAPYFPVALTSKNPNGLDYSKIETDWQDEVFNSNAVIQNYHLSMSGGNERGRYAVSASYFNQDGTIIGSNYERLTVRVNTSNKVKDWLTVGENFSFVSSTGRNAMNNNASPGASILSAALAMAPWDPAYYPTGAVNTQGKDLSGQISASSNFRNVVNPLSMVKHSHPEDKVERLVGDIFIELTPIKNLKLRSSVSMDLSNNRNKLFKDEYEYSSYDRTDKNFISSSMARYSTLIFENTANYSFDVKKHSLSAMIGQTTEEYNYYTIGGSGAKILNPTLNNWLLSQTTYDKTFAGDGTDRTRMFSLLGRLHYSYGSKYMATFNFRADASSKFPENLWGYFPSMALAWRISEENFMKDIYNLDYLKLRLGWGQIGNDKIDQKSFLMNMFNEGPTFVDYVLGTNPDFANGATVLSYVNKGGKWENTEQWNAGLDFGFFNNKLSGNVDLFLRDTHHMILSVKAPAHVSNLHDPKANVGTVRNQGIEITLEHQNKVGELSYSVSGNASFVKNELRALNGGARVYGDRTISDEGYALYTLWGYKYEGIYESDIEALQHLHGYDGWPPFKAGDAKFADLNGDGIIDDNDKTDLGNPFPWLTYGINLGGEYKNFDLQLFIQGVYGNKIYNALRERLEGKGLESSLSVDMRDVWTETNPTGSIPNPYGNSMNAETSSRFVESGAYMRLKNIQLGYTFPRKLVNKVSISRLRVYTSFNNLFTLTGYSGYDPEVGGGVDYGNYPQARTLTFGVNVDF